MDYGERYTDKKISAVDRELKQTYRTAQTELKEKLSDFMKKHAVMNREKRRLLAEGKITQQEYQDWLTGQIFTRNRWQQQIKAINSVLLDHNQQALNIVKSHRLDVFAENYNYNAWKAERETGVSFNIYSSESVARLIEGDPQLLPEWEIDKPKDYLWNQKRVNNILRQGILQGEDMEQIVQRLCVQLATSNEKKMRNFARTAMNGAQNAGRQKQMENAAAMGIEVMKRWMAVHDSRTRDAHRELDGEEVAYDKPFKCQLGEIMFPGDPTAEPANVYNCRCRTVTIYPKYEDRSKKWGEGEIIDGLTYEEWKKGKKKNNEVVQTKQNEKSNTRAGAEKGKPMTHAEADNGRVNPNFYKSEAYRVNCQSCVVTYEARLRGYDVEVVPNDNAHPMCKALAKDTRLAWKNKDGTQADFLIGENNVWRSRAVFPGETPTAKRFERMLMQKLEDDGRYTLEFKWKGVNEGHIVTLQKDMTQLVIYDPQVNRLYRGKQVSDYLDLIAYSRQVKGHTYYKYPCVMRVDDKEFDFDVANQIMLKRDGK